MKKNFTLLLLLLIVFGLKAQQFVSTEPQKRNVLIEEFTGINCSNCPSGHLIANQITSAYPNRAWSVNIHSGSYAPTYYPNFNTDDGEAISNGFNISSWPKGVVNRSTAEGLSRTEWGSHAGVQFEQNAECNVAGQVFIDKDSRTALITVEVYYTANSSSNTNYINVIMLQDNIMGPQSGGSANPDQYVNGQYRHMHAFRDAITPTWGEAISPTTAGTLITKTYNYNIPYSIGSPNGITVDIDDIYFVAFVTEKYQGVPTRPILNVNKLISSEGSNQEVYPYISDVVVPTSFCSNDKELKVTLTNGGMGTLSSLDFQIYVDNNLIKTHEWEGSIESHHVSNIDIPLQIQAGEHEIMVKIVEANGLPFDASKTISLTVDEWSTMTTNSEEENITIEIMQDKYGNQTTWELIASDNSVIASGGPYNFLSGSSATELHQENVSVPAGECVKFVIRDDGGNGICCQFGEGYYRILDSRNNIIVDGSGDFGSEASELVSIVYAEAETNITEASICEGESYTENGFNIINPEVGYLEEQYTDENGVLQILKLTVVANPEVTIEGNTNIYIGESVILTASGADSYLWSTGETAAIITVSPEETTTYSVVGTKDGCEGTAEVTVNVTVGVEEVNFVGAKIYPNPTEGELKIECKEMQEIIVYKPTGQIIEQIVIDANEQTLNIGNYETGIYFVKIVAENGICINKIIKK